MSSDPVKAHAQADGSNKRQDDFDMAKLRKTLKHEHRQSLLAKQKVSKLTPAEIRSLNHSAGGAPRGSSQSRDRSSGNRFATPPLTPDDHSLSHQFQHRSSHSTRTQRNNSDLPTPPTSPARERRGSNASGKHIHAPIPVSHAQGVNIVNVVATSRPHSASSYRGVATYRGPEITRNGSVTMLHTPMQQIVSNPLSQFSRPRQSTLPSPIHKQPSELRASVDRVESPIMKQGAQTTGGVSRTASRNHSPIRPSDSPVSMEDGQVPERRTTPRPNNTEIPVVQVTRQLVPDQPTETNGASKKQKSNWRKTLAGSFEFESEPVLLRKEYQRRTFVPGNGYCLHAINYADTKAGEPPQLRDTLKNELPSTKTAEYNKDDDRRSQLLTEYGQHPAVRPLNPEQDRSGSAVLDSAPSSNKKGKEREVDDLGETDTDAVSIASSVPSYSRCACCGRVQKTGGGFESDLSPVLENENLRTNFTFEIERMSNPDRLRRSSSRSSHQRKYVPIIPMEIGNETKQARIEPDRQSISSSTHHHHVPKIRLPGVAVNKPGDIIAPSSAPLAIMPRPKEAPKFVRFASLHTRKEERSDQETQHKAENHLTAPQPVQLHRFGSLYGLRNASHFSQQSTDDGHNTGSRPETPQLAAQSQTNGHHPLRSSFSAHQEIVPTTPTNRVMEPIEKPLGDSPSSPRIAATPVSPQYEVGNGQPMFDLSSFDGSFVKKSLSRSATVLKEAPARTGSEVESPDSLASASDPTATRTSTPHSSSSQEHNKLQNRSHAPQPSTSDVALPPPIDTKVGYNTHSFSSPTPPSSRKPTTIVRMVPSNTVSATSSPTSATYKGQMKLGDWVLPESPHSASAAGSVSSGKTKPDIGVAS